MFVFSERKTRHTHHIRWPTVRPVKYMPARKFPCDSDRISAYGMHCLLRYRFMFTFTAFGWHLNSHRYWTMDAELPFFCTRQRDLVAITARNERERGREKRKEKKLCHSFDIDDDDNFAPNKNCAHWIYDGAAIKISLPISTNELTTAIVHIDLCGAFYSRFFFFFSFCCPHWFRCRSSIRMLIISTVCVCVCDKKSSRLKCILRSATQWSKFKIIREKTWHHSLRAQIIHLFRFFLLLSIGAICDILILQIKN